MRSYKVKRIAFSILLIMIVVTTTLFGCVVADPWQESLYLTDLYVKGFLVVGEDEPPLPLSPGSAYFDAGVRMRTDHGGFGLVVLGHNTIVPLHTGIGSFDLTGGLYENLFTSATPLFEAEDMERSNWIVIAGGEYFGASAEIETYIDVNSVALHTFNWAWDMTDVPFVIVSHPIFASCAAGHVHIDAKSIGGFFIHSYDHTGRCLLKTELEAATDGIGAVCIEVDADDYSSVRALEIEYNTGDYQPGERASVIKVSLDDTEAVSSDATTEIDFVNLLTTSTRGLEKHGIHVGQSFTDAFRVSGGVEEDPDYGYTVVPDLPEDKVTGVPPDGTAFLEGSASDTLMFLADNDYILIGSDATFEAIDVILVAGANQPILEEYYYSTGAGTWATLVVEGTTNGFTQSGTITFNAPAAWALSNLTQPAGAAISNAFYVKIVRTRNNLGAYPQEDYFKTFTSSSVTDFTIRGDGTVKPVEVADAAAPNNSLYYSTTQNKLVYKDSGGVVRDLW